MTPEEIEAKRLQDELEAKVNEPEPKLDDDGNVIEDPAWMQEGGGDGTLPNADDGGTVPLAALIKTKRKLKGQLGEKDEELETLRQENARLKQGNSLAPDKMPKRPRRSEFGDSDEDDDAFEVAMDAYEEEKLNYSTNFAVKNTKQTQDMETRLQAQTVAVDAHYERAEKLVAEHSISPEVFQKTDETVKGIIESVLPKQGEAVFDHLVSMVGEGSEKTMFFVGRNKAAQAEFHSLLARDTSGLQAALYLGRITERISGPKSKTSQAPAPAARLKGDAHQNQGSAEYRKWAAAHKKGNAQEAYELKKTARKAGIDTKGWR